MCDNILLNLYQPANRLARSASRGIEAICDLKDVDESQRELKLIGFSLRAYKDIGAK